MTSEKVNFEWRVEGNDEWYPVFAFDAYEAAKKAAEHFDRDDRLIILSGACPVFEIRRAGEDQRSATARHFAPIEDGVTRWTVWGECVPTYYPSQLR